MFNKVKGLWELTRELPQAPLEFCERGAAVSQLLATLEGLSPGERSFGGINDWDLTKRLFNSGAGITNSGIREIFVRGLALARVGSSLVLLVGTDNNVRFAADSVGAISYFLGNRYTINGSDGAEQYAAIIFAASALGRLGGGENKDLAVDFISTQTAFSYFVAGAVKALGREWINGTAVERVVRTEVYGNRRFYRFLRRHPRLSEALTFSTVLLEILFPLLLLNRATRRFAMGAMFAFHAANVPLMGLGRSFLVFTSTYPAIINTVNRIKAEIK